MNSLLLTSVATVSVCGIAAAIFAAGEDVGTGRSGTGFWAPVVPPRTHYTIDCSVVTSGRPLSLRGTEVIRLTNMSERPIFRLALACPRGSPENLEIEAGGASLPVLGAGEGGSRPRALLFELAEALLPGQKLELEIGFRGSVSADETPDDIKLTGWHPRLWWGFETHDDYSVKVEVPEGYALGTSGRLEEDSGRYEAKGVRSFGLFLGKGMTVIKENAGDVVVRAIHTEKGEECARLLVQTTVDVINFYRERFGFYPHKSLTIVPGMVRPAGGYPVASAMVAIHGQERMSEMPEIHWRWITAHEIGHQYCGEHVLEKDSPDWLFVGLGIYADREYARARALGLEKHQEVLSRYISGVRRHLDTTIDRTEEELAHIDFDFNNVVVHGKGFGVVSALACLLGREAFDRAYQRCLREYAGRRMSVSGFRAVCEEESQQDLGWFFEQWVRSSRYLSYQVTSKECREQDGKYLSKVRVECLGTLKMPVPVEVSFEDGTSELRFTDRLLEVNELKFVSSAPLERVRLDPDHELPLVVPPPSPAGRELSREIERLAWTGAGNKAVELFKEAKEAELSDVTLWFKLGMTLYDGEYYQEALEAFERTNRQARKGSTYGFAAAVWQGHMKDFLGRREEALQHYREALELDTGDCMRHDQYGMKIDRRWVEERLKKPFERK